MIFRRGHQPNRVDRVQGDTGSDVSATTMPSGFAGKLLPSATPAGTRVLPDELSDVLSASHSSDVSPGFGTHRASGHLLHPRRHAQVCVVLGR